MDREGKKESCSFLLGIGFDNHDGHYRLTKGDHFQVIGGSEKTHRKMQDKMMELSDDLAREGRTIGDIRLEDMRRVAEILKD